MSTHRSPTVEFEGSCLHRFLKEMKKQQLTIANLTAKQSRQFVLHYCNRCHIPPHLRAIDLFIENISDAIESVRDECDDLSLLEDEFGEGLIGLSRFADFMGRNIALLEQVGAFIWHERPDIVGDEQHPMVSQWGRYPIYSMLMNSAEDNEYTSNFNGLQIIVLAAYSSLSHSLEVFSMYMKDQEKRSKTNQSSASSAGFFIRNWSDNNVDDDEIEFFCNDINVYEWCEDIIAARDDSATEERPLYRQTMSPLISRWISFESQRRGVNAARKRGKAKPYNRKSAGWHGGYCRYNSGIVSESFPIDDNGVVEAVAFGEGLSSISVTGIKVKKTPILNSEEEAKYADLEEDEQGDYDEIISVEDPTPSCNNILTKRQITKVVQSNQNLICQFSNATNVEIAQLVKLCLDVMSRPAFYNDFVSHAAPIALLMLYTGCSLRDVTHGTRWSADHLASKAKITSVLVSSERFWFLKVANVRRTKRMTQDVLAQCRVVESYIKIPDEFGLADFLKAQHKEHLDRKETGRIFKKKLPQYRLILNKLLRLLPNGNRLNEHKIANFLPAHITHQTGDIAATILSTGQYLPLGKTLLHYSAPSPHYLENSRGKVWNKLCRDIPLPSFIKPEEDKLPAISTSSVSPLCPTLDRIFNMVKESKSAIKSAKDSGDILNVHNMMTYYTAQMFAYGTGVRAICSPLACLTAFDSATKTVVISDKDGDDFYNSRLCILPKLVCQQLEAYQKHVEQLKNTTYFLAINNNSLIDIPDYFYLDKDLNPIEIKPSLSFALQEPFLHLPMNTNRRFIRTYLMEKGVRGELINAFMGHWGVGQEPWGKFSTCSPFELIEMVAPNIDEMLTTFKFTIERGLADA
ncbi:hypothetical protein [Marinomonas sp. IMCC 4694]|uniref:hypothetical protein n=1 Tax=Marinomonas sp. IMCC 4694 TaxID=2605432 RepID=UPI0011E7705E|nr:hypothetical protein [Marinomonas sp. IMCC 4694]TYL46901.1 hypothetical protein FXV75_02520 [Marinomonas sp. IMCC 4694]